MARINTNRAKVAFAIGATWGTAPDMTAGGAGKLTHCSQFTINGSRGRFNPRDNGFDNFIKEIIALEESVSITASFDVASGNWWPLLVAHFMGTSSTPTETTGGQGDYLHNIDFTNEIDGEFLAASFLVEDDRAIEIPSLKMTSLAGNFTTNGVGTITINAVCDQLVTTIGSQVNNATDVNTLVYPTVYESLVLGGTNHYFRMNAQGGAALNNTNDLKILGVSFNFARPMQPDFALRGANSKYTDEPQQLGPTTGTLTVQLKEIDDSIWDFASDWKNLTEFKAELFMDGTQIGTGVNRSNKYQFPRLASAPGFPGGHDIPNANSLMQPNMVFQVLQAATAPTGMTGVTNYMRLANIDNNNFDYN